MKPEIKQKIEASSAKPTSIVANTEDVKNLLSTTEEAQEKAISSNSGNTTNQANVGNTDGKQTFYFTHYDLGDVKQNDSTPCIGASGKDLCHLARQGAQTMALTKDIRKKLGVKFGDKVKLVGEDGCAGVYQVEDEMNQRFRERCVLRPGTNLCIKGDLSNKKGGACKIYKL